VERERAEQTDERNGATQFGDLFTGLDCKQVPTEAWFGALSVLEFDNGGGFDGLLLNAEVPCGYLGDDVLLDFEQFRWVTALARGNVAVPITAFLALDIITLTETEP